MDWIRFDLTCGCAAMRRRIRGILMSGKQFSLDSRMDLVQGFKPIQEPGDDRPGTVEEESDTGNAANKLAHTFSPVFLVPNALNGSSW